jgi:hypothetical protein
MKPIHFVLLLFCAALCVSQANAQWKKAGRFTAPGGGGVSLTWLKSSLYAASLYYDMALLRSGDNGVTWQRLPDLLPIGDGPFALRAITGSDSLLFQTGSSFGDFAIFAPVYYARSTDGGLTWHDNATLQGGRDPHLTVLPSGRVIIVHSGKRNSVVHFSTDGGVGWDSTASAGLPSTTVVEEFCTKGFLSIVSAPDNGTRNRSLYRTMDYGQSWELLSTGLSEATYRRVLFVGESIVAITQFGPDSSMAIVSTDDGLTWNIVPEPSIEQVDYDVQTDGKVLFGTNQSSRVVVAGIGQAWRSWGEGLPGSVSQIALSDSFAFALRYISYSMDSTVQEVWRRPLAELVSVANPRDCAPIPTELTLAQNFPNPFNPTTNIQFTIVNRQLTIVKVYDILGSEVATLVNEVKRPGTYSVQFDATGLASGVYFYRLQAGQFVQTKRLLLLR